MRVLLMGSGGREHALATSLVADPAVTALTVAPGNPGIADLVLRSGERVSQRAVDPNDREAVVALAVAEAVDLVVVGPEGPLVAGLADAVRAAGVACFGPSKAAARIEGSKAFAKDVMRAAKVPTAGARECRDLTEVAAAMAEFGAPYVIKDDGLAAGKGVLVTLDQSDALTHARSILGSEQTAPEMGQAGPGVGEDSATSRQSGRSVLVEEYLAGPEVSLFVITDGTDAVPLLPAQDSKRLGDGDTGPNTGGMGAYAPLPWAPSSLVDEVLASTVHPVLAEMSCRDSPFVGLLYVGLVLTDAGPKVIEFNCRFGDPETQVVLALLATPLAGLLHAAATGSLAEHGPAQWRPGAAVTVVVAAPGYPGRPHTGDVITGADGVPGVLHAGTTRAADGSLRSAGGRVLCCTGCGDNIAAARAAAYTLVDGVSLAGSQHRRDIASAVTDVAPPPTS